MPSSASRPGRRPDPATRQLWQQRLERLLTISEERFDDRVVNVQWIAPDEIQVKPDRFGRLEPSKQVRKDQFDIDPILLMRLARKS